MIGKTVFLAAALALTAAPAAAAILTFDEPTAGTVGALSTDPYVQAGLTFTSPYIHGVWFPSISQNARDGTNVFEAAYSDLTIAATNGGSFTLNGFDYGAGIYADPPMDFSLTFTFADATTLTVDAIATGEFQHWDAGGVALTKLVISTPHGYIALDNVNYSAAPEPASWAMMLGGFGLVGGAMRRRRAGAALA